MAEPLRPDPDAAWCAAVEVLEDAWVVPPTQSAMVQAAGVLRADGSYAPMGATWRGRTALTTEPPLPEAGAKLSGAHLYGGLLWVHFGHFLCESTSRLWAAPEVPDDVQSIVFFAKRPRLGDTQMPLHTAFLEMMGIDLPLTILTEPTQFERLHVPGQGFGLGTIAEGTPAFRQFIHSSFAQGIAAEGPERLYLSRSALGAKRGGIFAEEYLEQNLAREGYEIFHPQKHTMAEQIARYKAARQIVSLDGSALHLFGFVARPEQQVAMILRRSHPAYRNIVRQLQGFAGIETLVIDAIQADWVPEGRTKADRLSVGQLDLERLADALRTGGFIDSDTPWEAPNWRYYRRAARAMSKGPKSGLRQISRTP
ncbi:MAG: glycosyltransferase family 61 protein [Pseudomonadota bacterium]